jgi:hypothetical protein
VETHIGKRYEAMATFSELLRAVTASNTQERTDNVFCSELAGLFYKKVIESCFPDSLTFSKENMLNRFANVSNLIPEQFCYQAEEHDVLHGIADKDVQLKYVDDFVRRHNIEGLGEPLIEDDDEVVCCLIL